MGELTKKTFRDDVDYACDRRLALELGKGDARWHQPLREIAGPPVELVARRARGAEPGKRYEQAIYDRLRHDPHAIYQSAEGRIVQTLLSAGRLRELAAQARERQGALLLEHEWAVSEGFVRAVFGLGEEAPVPVLKRPETMRPDLILLVPYADGAAPREALRSDGAVVWAPAMRRVGVQLIDIKHVHEQSVGRAHFMELLVYAHALARFLEEQGLDDALFVEVAGHGILPNLESVEVAGLEWGNLRRGVIPMVWRDVAHLYARTCARIRALHAAAPRPIEAAEPHIQPSCGRCGYVNDCVATLGCTPGRAPATWDLRLLPLTSRSVAEQLRARGLATVGDVVAQADALAPGEVPEPLFAELPTLRLKGAALAAGAPLPPRAEHTGGQEHRTLAIPRLSQLNLFFALETDPSTERVFAAGMLFVARAGERIVWQPVFVRLLEALRAQVGSRRRGVEVAPLRAALDADYLATSPGAQPPEEALVELVEALRGLQADAEVTILLPGETPAYGGASSELAELRVQWSNLNNGLSLEDEQALAADLIQQLDRIIALATHLEGLVGVMLAGEDGERFAAGPDFAGFYWSSEQVQHGKALMERHLRGMLHEEALRAPFLRIVQWLAPLESAVERFEVRKKLFDLRDFVESTIGLPGEVINYAWHSVYRRLREHQGLHAERIDPVFWAPHFNYMDFMPWYEMLDELNVRKRAGLQSRLLEQLDLKVRSLARILGAARSINRHHIAETRRRPVRSSVLKAPRAPEGYHALARAWALYASLSHAAQGLEAEHIRTTFPAWSINRLRAAEVSALAVAADGVITFTLAGLSAHVKVSEGDTVLLIPAQLRDRSPQPSWEARLTSMRWDGAERCWRCEARSGSLWRVPHLLLERAEDGMPRYVPDDTWFVYPAQLDDYWSRRLGDVLSRHHLGDSWLGERLAFLHRLSSAQAVEPLPAAPFAAPEVYAFAPGALPAGAPLPGPLQTPTSPPPDPSQRAAILTALGRTLTCLQGPPGTGKSATIAALIDEFLLRHAASGRGPARVLVTAFSYQAMQVVLRKVLASRDASGAPTTAARTRCLFMRSTGREPVEGPPGARLSDLVFSGSQLLIDGAPMERRGGRRLDDHHVPEPFILFANAHSLVKLGAPSKAKRQEYEHLSNGFGFDLIIIDEASQLPMDQALAALNLVKPGAFTGRLITDQPVDQPIHAFNILETLTLEAPGSALTQVVVVGDQHQLPPVQPVKPPERLRPFLSSVFASLLEVHALPVTPLQVNYRSHPTLVEYTQELGLYRDLRPHHTASALPALPPPPEVEGPGWLREILAPERVVSAVLLEERFNTALSTREAEVTARLAVAFLRQLAPGDAAAERRFWAEELGVVSPHNAQGNLIIRRIQRLLTEGAVGRLTRLEDAALEEALRSTIYSVEKFQGSDRTFIIASFGVSARDQLQAEEAFIYDLNRFNVLTSRAKQKMLLICSRAFLDYTPRDRDVMAHAARIRDYALTFCDQGRVEAGLEPGERVEVRWRG